MCGLQLRLHRAEVRTHPVRATGRPQPGTTAVLQYVPTTARLLSARRLSHHCHCAHPPVPRSRSGTVPNQAGATRRVRGRRSAERPVVTGPPDVPPPERITRTVDGRRPYRTPPSPPYVLGSTVARRWSAAAARSSGAVPASGMCHMTYCRGASVSPSCPGAGLVRHLWETAMRSRFLESVPTHHGSTPQRVSSSGRSRRPSARPEPRPPRSWPCPRRPSEGPAPRSGRADRLPGSSAPAAAPRRVRQRVSPFGAESGRHPIHAPPDSLSAISRTSASWASASWASAGRQ